MEYYFIEFRSIERGSVLISCLENEPEPGHEQIHVQPTRTCIQHLLNLLPILPRQDRAARQDSSHLQLMLPPKSRYLLQILFRNTIKAIRSPSINNLENISFRCCRESSISLTADRLYLSRGKRVRQLSG